MKQKEKITHCC